MLAKPVVLVLAGAVVTVMGARGVAVAADPQWSGATVVDLGDTVTAELAGFGGEVHQFLFTAPTGTKVGARVEVTAGDLVPELRLVKAGGRIVDVGRKLDERKPASPKIGSFGLPGQGVFAFQVRAASGTGTYALVTSAKVGRKHAQASETDGDVEFDAIAGAVLRSCVLAPAKGSAALPGIDRLEDPDGVALAITPTVKGSVATLKDTALPKTGRYRLVWTNDGTAGDAVKVRMSFKNPKAVAESHVLGRATGVPATVVDKGDPVLAPRAGYVGSDACAECHGEVFLGWSTTGHNNAVRTWDRPGLTGEPVVCDVDRNGIDDFKEGFDLGTIDAQKGTTYIAPDWVAYGANAPKLRYVEGDARPYKIVIGDATYDIWRVWGGNGTYKQRFLTKIGNSLYRMPVGVNDSNRTNAAYTGYIVYNGNHWYDAGKAPLYTQANVAATISRGRSFEANCSGCHNTGETIALDAASGDFVTGYVEFNIGCEQCHGPGKAHVDAAGDASKILNPARRLDGTSAGVAAANAMCGRCHTRGDSKDLVLGGPRSEMPFSATLGTMQAGDDLSQFLDTAYELGQTNRFWGFKVDPLAAIPGDTFVAAKSHHQQSIDIEFGAHATDSGHAPACFSCHDPHSRRNAHQVASRVRGDGITDVRTRAEDGTLCLACHAGAAPFAGVSKHDVSLISAGTLPAVVADAVVAHMKDIGMPVAASDYDPAGTGVGNCVRCHMPRTAASAGAVKDEANYSLGDLATHTFRAIWPRASKLYGVTNSCNGCHRPSDVADAAAAIIEQWAVDGPDADGTFHADTPRNYENTVANAESAGGGVACVACHTTAGFLDLQVKGRTFANATERTAYIDATLKDALANDMGITCAACHGARQDGTFAAGANPLRFPKADLCGRCHNNETVVFQDFDASGEIVRHPQREMLEGTAGAEPLGYVWADTAHSSTALLPNKCVDCHYDSASAGDHRFEPKLATCQECHAGLTTFNRPAGGDYDGVNGVQGIQDEVTGLLALVQNAILAHPGMSKPGAYFEYSSATDHKLTGAPAAVKRAVFNYLSVSYDASKGVHNAARAIQLLQRSYAELTGSPVPGATIR